jgi:hypothetical protein
MRTEAEIQEALSQLWKQLDTTPTRSDAAVLLDQRILALRWVMLETDEVKLNNFAIGYYGIRNQFHG